MLAAAPASPASLAGHFMTDQARVRAGRAQLHEYDRAVRASQKDTVEITHQRMMRELRAYQPVARESRTRAVPQPVPQRAGRRGGY